MAKFFYGMQNILDIKYKLEDAAKQEYADAMARLDEEEKRLKVLYDRKHGYYEEYLNCINGHLIYLKIEECANAIDVMDLMIAEQNEVIKRCSKELEMARTKLNHEMQERKMHEKLKEKKFDEFLIELNAAENKETDEVVSYRFNSNEEED